MAPVTMATEREKLNLVDQLTAEQLKQKKYALYAAECEDEDLSRLFSRLAKSSAQHEAKLQEIMRETGLSIQQH
ncbi:MAG: hypothetical protein ACOX2S_07150 [bacterium]|jgi:rubrerythrin